MTAPDLAATDDGDAASMWTPERLAECVLAAPQDGGINVGLARDLARATLSLVEQIQHERDQVIREIASRDQWRKRHDAMEARAVRAEEALRKIATSDVVGVLAREMAQNALDRLAAAGADTEPGE